VIDLRLGDCLELMRALPDASVDCVITDPPYNSGLDYGETYHDERPYDEYWGWLRAIVIECNRVAKLVIVKHSSLKVYDWTAHIDKSRLVIWYKPFSSGFPMNGFATHFEPLWVTQGKATHWSKDVFVCNSGNGNREDTTGHPAQMPEVLAKQIISVCTSEGDTVLDPFMGSGTTGVACVKLGRSFIGMEINPDYFKIAEERIAEAQLQMVMPL
jgi:site-specific DNA-methyltransferase (adenine-specific)